ncbi:MAG: AAA family ATPase [Prevotella sp.]|nr:AAA family ATPase [Prevotella sp.]
MEKRGCCMKAKKPTLCVVAGPNGSGKTTTTVQLLNNEWATDSLYINPDNIAQESFGDWNSPEAVLKAAEEATRMRYECLNQGRDFVFETVFSASEKLEFLHKAKEAGYFIRLFYVCTSDPAINVVRIAQRYMDGGHEVPISKIISRYYKSLVNAAKAISIVDRAYVYDNSIDNQLPRLLYRTTDGQLFKQYTDDIPEWAKTLIDR